MTKDEAIEVLQEACRKVLRRSFDAGIAHIAKDALRDTATIEAPASEAVVDLIKRLREHDDARLYAEADLLMHEAANALAAQPVADPAPVIHQSQMIDEWGVESGWVTYTPEQIEKLRKEPQGWGYRTVYRTIPGGHPSASTNPLIAIGIDGETRAISASQQAAPATTETPCKKN